MQHQADFSVAANRARRRQVCFPSLLCILTHELRDVTHKHANKRLPAFRECAFNLSINDSARNSIVIIHYVQALIPSHQATWKEYHIKVRNLRAAISVMAATIARR